MSETIAEFQRLLEIMDNLRDNCPWDKKQTFETLRHLTIEETYELADAITDKNYNELRKELGDLMLHIVFYARIASEERLFNIKDVLHDINEKLISRHPHIYGDVKVENEEQVKNNWEKIKLKEKGRTVLSGVPASLPAMIKAYRIQDKARGVGFDWENQEQVWNKVIEELNELQTELIIEKQQEKIEDEFGDLLFALINYSRFINVNPETALERTNKKFIRRFSFLENEVKKAGKSLLEMSLDEMNFFWEEAKKQEKFQQ